ncbi:hypothetical protein [Bifidobacterium stellenboschense]|uniref:Uncharacterized protein n=1 Tax=Bifidobacterium stellenboschense TaxID=762211 RepID=A0A087DKS1_9BIFI|nr:hypothetical protein [Bifidobacterium stellenboschense]KFI96121.1 hypothetical protein BSTEL_1154 [Bifidobacterium stellenboschense]
MFENIRAEYALNNPATNPHHWMNRGWHDVVATADGDPFKFDLPRALFWTAVSGREKPAGNDHGGTLMHPWISWKGSERWNTYYLCNDMEWKLLSMYSYRRNMYQQLYRPVRLMPRTGFDNGRDARFAVLRAPFPLTSDSSLTLHATCSLGHVDDPPFMPPYTGRPSARMVELMNGMAMKPGWIVWDGYLHVWVNYLYWSKRYGAQWKGTEQLGVPVPVELALFRAYRVYYEQLRHELPYPYAGPVSWPDQCDPRFPLPSDPRYGAYV